MLSSLNRLPGGSLWAGRSFSLSAPSLNKLIFKQSATGEGGVLREVREGSLSRWITVFSWSLVFSPDSGKTQVTVPGGFQNFLSLANIDLIPSCLKSPRLLLLSVGPSLHRAAHRRSPACRPVLHPSHLPSESRWASVHLQTWTQAVLVTPVSLLSPLLLVATSVWRTPVILQEPSPTSLPSSDFQTPLCSQGASLPPSEHLSPCNLEFAVTYLCLFPC